MKTGVWMAAAAALATLAMPAAAQQRALSDPVVGHPDPESLFTSPDPKLHRNKQAALHIQRELLKCSEWSRAGEWLTSKYIQHNPVAASGLEGVIYYFTQVAKRQPLKPCPALSANDPNAVVAVVAEGDYVTILTRRIVPYADDASKSYTTTWFDTWRFVDGKADEHWDPATLPPAPPPQAAAPAAPAGGMAMNGGMMAEHQGMMERIKDRDAIEALMWRYDRALDRFETEKYVALYTEDGAFGQTKGRAALTQMMSGFKNAEGGPPKLQHASSNHWVEFTGPDSARIHYYWQTYALSPTGQLSDPPRLLAAGNGVDVVVKQNGQWLFKSRDVIAPNE